MPFDPVSLDATTYGFMAPHEKLEVLAAALRGRLPDDFVWDFRRIDSCAVGLARHLKIIGGTSDWALDIATAFGISTDDAQLIFGRPLVDVPPDLSLGEANVWRDHYMYSVQPIHVAKRIETYLATHGIGRDLSAAEAPLLAVAA